MRSLRRAAELLEDGRTGTGRSFRLPSPDFRVALGAGLLAVAALAVGSDVGDIRHGAPLHDRLIALGCALAFLALGSYSVRRAANEANRVLVVRVGAGHAAVVRLVITVVGLALVGLLALGLLAVPLGQLVLGGALTGVVVGIAAQQALGNVFAGLVLLLARPFTVGDAVRIRSGALGGETRGTVTAISLTYVTLQTDDGPLSLPNAGVLSAAVGPLPAPTAATLEPAPPPAPARTRRGRA